MTACQVISRFSDVKRKYFRRWDVHNEWRIHFADGPERRDATGYCDSIAKVIYLDDSVCGMTESGIAAFLIHEICHDVGAAGHNRRWAEAMNTVAESAHQHGERVLAVAVRDEVFAYTEVGVSKRHALETVVEWVESLTLDHPLPSLEETIRILARYLGVRSSKLRRDFGPVIADLLADVLHQQR